MLTVITIKHDCQLQKSIVIFIILMPAIENIILYMFTKEYVYMCMWVYECVASDLNKDYNG